jgi:hypothetical protein
MAPPKHISGQPLKLQLKGNTPHLSNRREQRSGDPQLINTNLAVQSFNMVLQNGGVE